MSQPPKKPQQAKRRTDRVVYESSAKKALKRSHPTVPGPGGKQHLYLNAALPRDHRTNEVVAPLQSAVCADQRRCGHAYSHLMTSGRSVCDECRLQDIAALAAELQAAGIELGWGATPMDKRAGKLGPEDRRHVVEVTKHR